MEDDNRYPWQKGENLLSFNDKYEVLDIYPESYKGFSYVSSKYVYPVDEFIVRMMKGD